MQRLADLQQRAVLKKLMDRIASGELTATNAWTCFSQPAAEKSFGKRHPQILFFSAEEVELMRALKRKAVLALEKKSGRTCSYCKRLVGTYGYNWHIEHVFCKSKYAALTFKLDNLVLACVDCNMYKNNHVDRKHTPYDIIDPSARQFNYSDHLTYLSLATEKICFVKYTAITPEGTNTYSKLKFELLERSAVLSSVDRQTRSRVDELAIAAERFSQLGDEHPMTRFLTGLKGKLAAGTAS
jgi:uncharacterized protein (TIGR02646 family)